MRSFLLLTFILVCISSCKNSCGEHFRYEVDFYTNHENFKIVDAVWETRTEQVLVKDSYLSQGAQFETVTEQVLVRDAYTYQEIADSTLINLVVDADLNTLQQIPCYTFFAANDFISTVVPAEYATRTFQKTINSGSGAEVPAEYTTRTYHKLIKDSELIPNEDLRTANSVIFNVAIDVTIKAYLENQLAQQNIENCIEGNSYDYK